MTSSSTQAVSNLPKKASDHIPYCSDQGIPYLVGTTQPGVAFQTKAFTMPAGGVFNFVAQGLQKMADGSYIVLSDNQSLSPGSVDSGAETYAINDGETITVKVDQAAAQTATVNGAAATLTSGNAETYDFDDGDDLDVKVDGAVADTATINGTPATVLDTTTYPVTDQDGLTSTHNINGTGVQTVTFSGATTTAAQVAAQIDAQLTNAGAVEQGGQVLITSEPLGSGVTIVTGAGTGNLTWDTPVAGTGDAVDLAVMTAAELAVVFTADIAGVTTIDSAGSLKMTSDLIGTDSSLEVTGGTANTGGVNRLGFSTTLVAGTGDAADMSAVTAAELAAVLNTDIAGAFASADGGVCSLASDSLGPSSWIEVTGGTANGVVGFSTTPVQGGGGPTVVVSASKTIDGFTLYGPDTNDVVNLMIVGRIDGMLAA